MFDSIGAFVLASHDVEFVEKACDKVYSIQPPGTLRLLAGGVAEFAATVKEAVAKKIIKAASG